MTTATGFVAFVDDCDVFVCFTCTCGNECIRSTNISVASAVAVVVVAVIVDYVPMEETLSSSLSC